MTIHRQKNSAARLTAAVISPATTARWRDFVLQQAATVQVWSGGWVKQRAPVKVRLARVSRGTRTFP